MSADRDRDQLRQQLAEVLAGHTTVIDETDDGRFRCGCTCGHERGVFTEAEALSRLRTSSAVADQRLHVADALLRVVEAHTQTAQADELLRASARCEGRSGELWADASDTRISSRRRVCISEQSKGWQDASDYLRARGAALRTHEGDTDGH